MVINKKHNKYKLTAMLFNAYFAFNMGEYIAELRSILTPTNVVLWKKHLEAGVVTKLEQHHDAWTSFFERWYRSIEGEDAWDWFMIFAENAKEYLSLVLATAHQDQREWLERRIDLPCHELVSLAKYKAEFMQKLVEIDDDVFESAEGEEDEDDLTSYF